MPKAPLLSDEVWGRLDPKAGRLGPHGRWALAGAAVLVAALVLGAYLVQASGLVRPRLSASRYAATADGARHTVTEWLRLSNNGWFGEQVADVRTRTPGVAVAGYAPFGGSFPLAGHDEVGLRVRLRFDCGRLGPGRLDLELRVHRFWGEVTVPVPRVADDRDGLGPDRLTRYVVARACPMRR